MKCAVVVDRASIEFRLKDLVEMSPPVVLDVVRLSSWFESVGFDVVEFSLVGPGVPWLGSGSHEDRAHRYAEQHRRWCTHQRLNLGRERPEIHVRELWGATTGNEELGVDVVVAAAVLDTAVRARELGIEFVLLMSNDSEYHQLHRYVTPVSLLQASSFTKAESSLLRRLEVPVLNIPANDFIQIHTRAAGVAEGSLQITARERRPSAKAIPQGRADDVVLAERDGRQRVYSSPLDHPGSPELPAVSRLLADCGSIVVVDPYGMMGLAITSIGIGALPTVDSVRETVASLGWDGPYAVLATIPDIVERSVSHLPAILQHAWWTRDGDLDALADSLEMDDDDRTVAKRSPLRIDRLDPVADGDLSRSGPLRKAKGLAVGLLADIWLARRDAPDLPVILVSEHLDLVAALQLLPLCGIDTYRSVVRIGVHDLDFLRLPPDAPLPDLAESLGQILLVDTQLAVLCCVDDQPFGGSHRQLLFHGLRGLTRDNPARVVDVDPETGANVVLLRVRFDTDGDGIPELHRITSLAFGPSAGAKERLTRNLRATDRDRTLTVVFDHQSPCAHPVLMYRRAALDGVEGIVQDQDGNWISVDLDGDGSVDARAPIGHAAINFDPGRPVLVGRIPSGHAVIDPGGSLEDRIEPEVVRVTQLIDIKWFVTSVDDGVAGPLRSASGRAFVNAAIGDFLFALRRETSRGVEFVAMSSPLAHLAAMLGAVDEV